MATTKERREQTGLPALRREAGAVALGVAGVLLGLAIVSYQPGSRLNLIGPLGAILADLMVQAIGLSALLLPTGLLAAAVAVFRGVWPGLNAVRGAALAGALVAGATLSQLVLGTWKGLPAGGIVGGFLREVLRDGFGDAGTWVLALAGLIVLIAVATGQSLLDLATGSGRAGARLTRAGFARLRRGRRDGGDGPRTLQPVGEPILLRRANAIAPDNVRRDSAERRAPVVIEKPPPPRPPSKAAATRRQVELPLRGSDSYCLPELRLFDPAVDSETPIDRDALIASARILEAKLGTFEVRGEVQGIHPGPVITTYEFEPAPGIKVGRVVALADDLAMAMRAMSVRILAPIPGKAVVGIEVANSRRERVLLREIVASEAFSQMPSYLSIALGKDTRGMPVAGDLARMPHLLVAGATGAGKSVFLNALVISILMRATPRDVRFVLIDPKMLEMSSYEQIPHLLVPVVTDAKPAVAVLNNLVKEMNDRYRLMRDKGVRNVDGYNRVLAEEERSAGVIELEEAPDDDPAVDDEDASSAAETARPVHEHMPRIVVIIDELADLMMSRRDCEVPITLLAQKARAAGIHLVVATQRPSVDVITGLIKANFPSRISFKVRQKVDSRTILDSMGAEHLLGEGDMLFLPPGTSVLQRLHGAFVSDDEIKRITDFVRKQEPQSYRLDLLEDAEEDPGDDLPGEGGEESYDEMYDAAVRVVTESGKASISYVQRRLQVGYNRAARMIECMEREGVVSGADHRGVREVLAPRIDE